MHGMECGWIALQDKILALCRSFIFSTVPKAVSKEQRGNHLQHVDTSMIRLSKNWYVS